MGDKKPRVLVLGGTGFIGRHLVDHLVTEELVSGVRVVDKCLPEMAYLTEEQQAVFASDLVDFVQGNLVSPATITKVFDQGDGAPFDIVINAAAETRWGLEVRRASRRRSPPLFLRLTPHAACRRRHTRTSASC